MKKLDLSKTAITDRESEEELRSAFDIIEETKEKMSEMGLEEYPRPRNAPKALAEIDDIDSLTNSQLGALYVQYVAYSQFISAKLSETIAGYRIAANNLKHLHANIASTLYAKEVPKAEVPARVKEDPLYKQYDAELVKFFAMKTLLEAHHRAYDKQAAALSRMISLRELEFQQSLRQDNIKKPKARRIPPNADLRGDGE
jgi:hypothetical protein